MFCNMAESQQSFGTPKFYSGSTVSDIRSIKYFPGKHWGQGEENNAKLGAIIVPWSYRSAMCLREKHFYWRRGGVNGFQTKIQTPGAARIK
jgi:hypothetical protein